MTHNDLADTARRLCQEACQPHGAVTRIAGEIGVSRQALSKFLNGGNLSQPTLMRLIEYLVRHRMWPGAATVEDTLYPAPILASRGEIHRLLDQVVLLPDNARRQRLQAGVLRLLEHQAHLADETRRLRQKIDDVKQQLERL